jgi:farnesyl-diphosphate farnesyltransferase
MSSAMSAEMEHLLSRVSRSFYLTIRALPSRVRPQIGLAYLLARTSDTIADTRLVPPELRRESLERLRDAIATAAAGREPGGIVVTTAGHESAMAETPAESVLLRSTGEMLARLRGFPGDDRRMIADVLATITSGQLLDLQRFGNASALRIEALQTDDELDDYTYRVAGCVGEFWTRICRRHIFPRKSLDLELLIRRGISFGKGLQLVNILRDIPKDLRQGRCYIPSTRLRNYALSPESLLNPASMSRFRPLFDCYLLRAEDCLAEGWEYTTTLPWSRPRLRLACAWPILIAVRTLALLRFENVLDERNRVKVSRCAVRRAIIRSLLLYPFPRLWNELFE